MNPQIQIRSQVLLARRKLTTEEQTSHAEIVAQRFFLLPEYKAAKHIAVYLACNGEIDLEMVINKASEDNKQLYLPIVNDEGMQFVHFAKNMQMQPNRFNILEPVEKKFIKPEQLDISLTPLVAFDSKLNRIGMGGGYYDRLFSPLKNHNKPTRIGIAHALQKVEDCFANEWDVPLHAVITEQTTHRC